MDFPSPLFQLKEDAKHIPALDQAIISASSGGLASAIADALLYPLDMVITRIQIQKKDVQTVLREIYDESGISGFYKGLQEDIFAQMLSTFFYHFMYTFLRKRRMTALNTKTLPIHTELAIGSIAGLFARFFTTPISNVVVRKQMSDKTSHDIAHEIYKEKGITGFWSGYRASAFLTINPSISYYFFEYAKIALLTGEHREKPTPGQVFLLSAVAKSAASAITYPLTITKARMQASDSGDQSPFKVIRDIVEKQGVSSLYDGLVAQMIKGFWTQGVTMLIKDRVSAFIVYVYFSIKQRQPTKGFGRGDDRVLDKTIGKSETHLNASDEASSLSGKASQQLGQARDAINNKGQQVYDTVSEKAKDTINYGNEKLEDAESAFKNSRPVQAVEEAASQINQRSREFVGQFNEKTQDAYKYGQDKVNELKQTDPKEAVSNLTLQTKETVEKGLEQGKARFNQATDAIKQSQPAQEAGRIAEQAQSKVQDFADYSKTQAESVSGKIQHSAPAQAARDASDKLVQAGTQAQSKLNEYGSAVKQSNTVQDVSRTAESASQKSKDYVDQFAKSTDETIQTAKGRTVGAGLAAKNTGETALNTSKDIADKAVQRTTDLANKTSQSVRSVKDRKLVEDVGEIVNSAIRKSIPPFDDE